MLDPFHASSWHQVVEVGFVIWAQLGGGIEILNTQTIHSGWSSKEASPIMDSRRSTNQSTAAQGSTDRSEQYIQQAHTIVTTVQSFFRTTEGTALNLRPSAPVGFRNTKCCGNGACTGSIVIVTAPFPRDHTHRGRGQPSVELVAYVIASCKSKRAVLIIYHDNNQCFLENLYKFLIQPPLYLVQRRSITGVSWFKRVVLVCRLFNPDLNMGSRWTPLE